MLPATVRITFAKAYAPVYPSEGTELRASAVTMLREAPLVIEPVIAPSRRTGLIPRILRPTKKPIATGIEVTTIPARSRLRPDCASVSMIPDPAILRLTVDIDAEASTTGDRSVSMGLIVTELVINSLKHAYPGEAKGAIRIGYHADHRGWILSVADDGIGITDSRASGKPGLGTGIVNALAGQLSARVEISDAAPGCLVSIVHRRDE